MSGNKHFDCLKNTLPDNWTNSNATGYYNRAFWKRCKCEYGTKNPCKDTADKWNPVATEPTKWTDGCTKCSDYYSAPPGFHYSYNPDDCGTCHKLKSHCSCGPKDHSNDHSNNHSNDHACECKKDGRWSFFCDKCKRHEKREDFEQHEKNHPLKSYVYNNCGGCQDVAIVYKMANEQFDCDNIVELKIPVGGTKEQYLAKLFPAEFIDANRFQCATVPVYNKYPNNLIDNMRAEEFTESDQAALVKRGIRNSLYAQQLVDEGKLIHDKQSFQIPMNTYGKTSYYYFGNSLNAGSTATGLDPLDAYKGYFKNLA
jgi:hypothetical protein